MQVEKHFRETEKLLREVSVDEVAAWFLNKGYFPESYVLPPSFKVSDFSLKKVPYNKDILSPKRRKIINISYPKTMLTSRTFGVFHPWNYHDIILNIYDNWSLLVDHLFNEEIKIYSYSLPIPINAKNKGSLSLLRSGRMIYEWIEMAEKDLIVDASSYNFIARTDITNFYSSIYTHSIGWALHGREEAFKDKECNLVGNKIDRLIQYSNDARTNGIPVGPALSDLIAEIILAGVDRKISNELKGKVDFLAVRFKDDYRILCRTEDDARAVLKTISNELSANNLAINESKTSILKLPDGLYRKHDREYFHYSLRRYKKIKFKVFEHTLLIALDIHRANQGTSILEKFISELFTKKMELKVIFSVSPSQREKQIKKMISLLFLMKRESEKVLCHVLSVSEQLYVAYHKEYPKLKEYLKSTIQSEIISASLKGSVFETVWLVFFSRYIGLGITNFDSLVDNIFIKNSEFYKTILTSQQEIFNESKVKLFTKPSECKGSSLANHLAVFNRQI